MAIRMTGMISNLDTDAIVKALMTGQTAKKTKIEANKQKLEWKQELWSDMNTKIYNFYKSSLSKIKMQSTYQTKTATSSDSSKVTATAGANATAGAYRVKVNSTASAQYVTSAKLIAPSGSDGVTSSTKLKDLVDSDFTEGTQIKIAAKDGTTYLYVDENTTVGDFVASANSVGLNASFDATQQRFFIGSKDSGEAQKFTITSTQLNEAQQEAVKNLKAAVGYDHLSSSDKTAVSKLIDGLQSGEISYSDDGVADQLKNYMSKAADTAVTNYYKDQISSRYKGQYLNAEGDVVTPAGRTAVIDSGAKTEEEFDNLSPEDQVKAVESLISSKVSTAMSDSSVTDAINATKETGAGDVVTVDGVNVSIAAPSDTFLSSGRAARESKLETLANDYNAAMATGANADNTVLNAMGLGQIDGTAKAEQVDANGNKSGMVVVAASDASVTFNGATLTSSNSILNVNGLTLNLLEKTDSELTITVAKDTSAVYDSIKDFLSEYNSILKSMNTSYSAASAKGYNVLTEDQKEAMSEKEIENWNNKIKSSLLRRDDTLNGLISTFRNNMMNSYTASNGKKYSLGSLGITTSTDYKEGGLLHIKGDEDDDVYMDEENTLKKMLDDDPDLVMEILTGVTNNLYEDLRKKMSSTKYSSAFTFYNDKQMTTQMDTYKKDISTWEKKLATLEDRYYSQFTAMEKTLANLQSQQSSLAGFFG